MKFQSLVALAALTAAAGAFANPVAAETKAAPAQATEAKPAAASHESKTMASDEKAMRHERWVAAQDSTHPSANLNSGSRQQRMDKALADWRSDQG